MQTISNGGGDNIMNRSNMSASEVETVDGINYANMLGGAESWVASPRSGVIM